MLRINPKVKASSITRLTSCLLLLFVAACNDSENTPPIAPDENVSVNEDTMLTGVVSATDPDGDVLQITVAQGPANGSVDMQPSGTYTYQPNPDFFGPDFFSLRIADGHGGIIFATVTIDVVAVNDAPIATGQTLTGPEDVAIHASLSVADVDSAILFYEITGQPAHGLASIAGGELHYAPNPDFAGVDKLTYSVNDGVLSNSATIGIEVTAVNDAPVATVASQTYALRGANVQLDGSTSSDPEGSALTYSWQQLSGPAITLSDSTSSQPTFNAPSATAVIGFSLTVSDGQLSHTASTEVRIAGWSHVVSRQHHTLGLREDGSLWAWGLNHKGQLGDGSTTETLAPKLINDSDVFTGISAGRHSLAIRDDGTLFAFGDNDRGQLGDGSTSDSWTPIAVPGGPYSVASAGYAWTVALRNDGTLWSWGINDPDPGELGRPLEGTGSVRFDPQPGQIGLAADWVDVRAGSNSTSARKSDGTLWSWGNNASGELGIGTISPIGSAFNEGFPTQVGTDTDWARVSRGAAHMFALKNDGSLWAAGKNDNGNLGVGYSGAPEPDLIQVGSDTDWQTVCLGRAFDSHSLGLKTNGTLWGWGPNVFGERGDSNANNVETPTQIGNDADWSYVSCGFWTSFAIKNDGSLWSWGANNVGQLGHGDTINRDVPVRVE